MPLAILWFLLFDLLSVALAGLDIYLFREWYVNRHAANDSYALQCLYGASALLVFMLLGKYPMAMLLSKRRPGERMPNLWRTKKREYLKRPDGTKIRIDHYGPEDAQPIIFVHGWNSDSREWFYQRKFFEKDYRLIFIDLPGLGRSSRPPNKDFSLRRMANDLDTVIKHTNAYGAILWGHSIGGMIIQTFCVQFMSAHPLQVKAIILQHTTYINPVRTSAAGKFLTKIRRTVLVPLCYLEIILSPFLRVMRWLSYLNGTHHFITRFLAFTGTQSWRQLNIISYLSAKTPPSVSGRGMLAMFRWGVAEWLYRIKVPVLIIAGSKDKLTIPEASRHINREITQSSLHTVEAGHMGMVERHEEVNNLAKTFINQLTPHTTTQNNEL